MAHPGPRVARRAALALALGACGRLGFAPGADASGDAGADAGADAGVAARTARTVVRLDRLAPTAPLDGVPVPLVLDDTRLDRAVLAPDAADLRVTLPDGTPLPVEVEQRGAAGGPPLVAWVRVPRVEGTATSLVIRYGDAAAPAASSPVWPPEEYIGVWHLTGLADAAGPHAAVPVAGPTASPGVIGGGFTFTAALEQHLRVPYTPDHAVATFTVSGWIDERNPILDRYGAVATREFGDTSQDDFFIGSWRDALHTSVQTTGGASGDFAGDLAPGWRHVALTVGGGLARGYIDGVLAQTPRALSGTVTNSANPMFFGAGRNGSSASNEVPDTDFLEGSLDEIRLERVARSAAWLAYQHALGRAQVLTYGPIEYEAR